MDTKILFGLLFLVSIVAHSQKSPRTKLFQKPKKNSFALNIPENMLFDEDRIFKNNLFDTKAEDWRRPKKNTNDMPIFEPSTEHSTPVFLIDSSRTHFLKVYAPDRMEQ